ncbi:MAG: rhodanese-like domain-containing protein [Acidobacteriota bacterium]|jgi:hypothetical protein
MKPLFQFGLVCAATASLALGLSLLRAEPQEPGTTQIVTDPQTGRAVGAKELLPDELHKLIGQNVKLIIIDVRDEAAYQQETIKGAIHIPLETLEGRLKEIPKDTVLVFT